MLLAAWLGSANPGLAAKFPINPSAGNSAAMFALHAVTYLLFYVGWEFYFRGFLLFGLRKSMGDANAVLVQALLSALMHIGDPVHEAFGAIPVGILWGMLALRTGSILTTLCQHFTVGLGLDAFLCWRR
jgi:membrane protease YdiL (CAAX protease family)